MSAGIHAEIRVAALGNQENRIRRGAVAESDAGRLEPPGFSTAARTASRCPPASTRRRLGGRGCTGRCGAWQSLAANEFGQELNDAKRALAIR